MPRLIRLKEVLQRTGDSRSGIYEKMAKGKFPLPVQLGDRTIAWVDEEIDAHVAGLIAERDARLQKGQEAINAERDARRANLLQRKPQDVSAEV